MFNKFATPDVEEEKARMRALVERFKNGSEDDEEKTDICPICLEEKSVNDLHRNCGK